MTELKECGNQACRRVTSLSSLYCCGPCAEAADGRYEIDAHSAGCDQRAGLRGIQTRYGLLAFTGDGWSLDGQVIPVPHAWTALHDEWKRRHAELQPLMDLFPNPGSHEIARTGARGNVIGPAHALIVDRFGVGESREDQQALTRLLAEVWNSGEKWGRDHA